MSGPQDTTARQGLRFLIAGAGNTLFGIADTFLWTWLLIRVDPAHPALMTSAATLLSTVINISVSFLSYKLFVFRTRGHYLSEYARSLLIYLPSLLLSTLAVGPLAALLSRWLPDKHLAPYAAQGVIVAIAVVPQFVGHKRFTFARRQPAAIQDESQ